MSFSVASKYYLYVVLERARSFSVYCCSMRSCAIGVMLYRSRSSEARSDYMRSQHNTPRFMWFRRLGTGEKVVKVCGGSLQQNHVKEWNASGTNRHATKTACASLVRYDVGRGGVYF